MELDIQLILRTYLSNMLVRNCSIFGQSIVIELQSNLHSFQVCLESRWHVVREDGTDFNSEQLQWTGEGRLQLQGELVSSFDGEILRHIQIESDFNDMALIFNKLILKTEVDNSSVSPAWFIIDQRLNRKFSANSSAISLTQC
ncbi:hypothetical protein ACFFSY_33170 [Paenibacillus aurantiacus]|uniref:Uncharacterized protein n=1 Tax=Paenibacillus aurantiacus TaxID=1936118 RepID=A0ABV5L014_9BACL